MKKNTALVLCYLLITLERLAIVTTAILLSLHTNNLHWMWLISLTILTSYKVRVSDNDDKIEEYEND